jgi:hypothetical protein
VSRTLLLAALLGAAAAPAAAGNIDVGWNAVVGASGYRVYLGTQPGQYSASIDVGPSTGASLSALADCTTYFLAVKAYNQSGESPSFSNELSGWARPELSGAALTLVQGAQGVIEIAGANFAGGAAVTLDESVIPEDVSGNPLMIAGPVSVSSCHRVEALVTVEPTVAGLQAMPLGELDLPIEIANPDGGYRSGAIALEVLFDESRADANRSNARTADRVDGDDLATLVRSWATDHGDTDFTWIADLDGDTDVDGEDLALLALVFGRCRDGERWTMQACRERDGA